MYEKDVGFVLREVNYKDSDKLLTVLTRNYGKLTLRARGVRTGRSRLKAACQLLTCSEFTWLEQQGRCVITEAVSQELFPELQKDIELFYLASYFVQVTDMLAQDSDPVPELLSLLLNSLYSLGKLHKPQLLVKAVFELRSACISGFLPDLRCCGVCGSPQPDRFNITHGVAQCASCQMDEGRSIRMPLSPGTLAAMRFICGADPKKLFSFTLSEAGLKELSNLTEGYLTMRLERSFSALDTYKSLFL